MTKFLFDLDGTITKKETLPLIADYFNIADEIGSLTKETLQGNVPFVESFIRRVHILGKLPVDQINDLISNVETYNLIVEFIREHKHDCVIVTGNIHDWVKGLSEKIGCKCYSSSAIIENNNISKLTQILRKETVVNTFKDQGERVVFIGDSNNDVEAMRAADISVGCGITHQPAPGVFSVADYLVYSEESLCRLLNQLS